MSATTSSQYISVWISNDTTYRHKQSSNVALSRHYNNNNYNKFALLRRWEALRRVSLLLKTRRTIHQRIHCSRTRAWPAILQVSCCPLFILLQQSELHLKSLEFVFISAAPSTPTKKPLNFLSRPNCTRCSRFSMFWWINKLWLTSWPVSQPVGQACQVKRAHILVCLKVLWQVSIVSGKQGVKASNLFTKCVKNSTYQGVCKSSKPHLVYSSCRPHLVACQAWSVTFDSS